MFIERLLRAKDAEKQDAVESGGVIWPKKGKGIKML